MKPKFKNPSLLEDLNIPLEVLEDEAAGVAFPLDAKYFDQFPIVSNDDTADIASIPKLNIKSLKELVLAKYGEKYLDCKAFPHLHAWGNGGWYNACGMPFQAICCDIQVVNVIIDPLRMRSRVCLCVCVSVTVLTAEFYSINV